MTPDRLADHLPQLLDALHPPRLDFPAGDAISVCRWLNEQSGGQADAPHPLGPLWPQLPQFTVNHYSLAGAPRPPQLDIADAGPIHLVSAPGVDVQGRAIPAQESSQKVAEHVIACNGEVAFERSDITIPGPFEFHWQRYYRHSNTRDSGLGIGWRHSLSEELLIDDGKAKFHSAEGRIIEFSLPAIGHSCYNRFERLLLHRQSLHSYRITAFDRPNRIFRSDGVNSALPLVEIRDRFGNALTIDYQDGLPRKMVCSWGRLFEFHCRQGRIEKLVDCHAPGDWDSLCAYQFDAQSLLEATTGLQRERYEYRQQLLAAIDCDSRGEIQFAYDSHQRCHELQINGLTQRLNWRRSQRLCILSSSDRHSLQWKFNDAGQLLGEQQQDIHRQYLYDLYGNLCQVTAADGQRCIYRHDELGRLTRQSCNGISDRYVYDTDGRLVAARTKGNQVWQFGRDASGLATEITDPEGHLWQCHYSERGQLLQLIDPEGGRVDLIWDSQAQLQSVQRGDRQWEFEFNHWRQLTSLVVDGETLKQWRYGPAAELKEVHFGQFQYRLNYDAQGRIGALQSDIGRCLTWHRDRAGNFRQIRFADNRQWHLQYNDRGQLTELETDTGKTRWRYDPYGRLASCRASHTGLGEWHYNPEGRVREYRDNDTRWYLEYSTAGTLRQIRNNSGQQCEFHYDPQQRLAQADNGHARVRFHYDRRNLLTAEHHDSKDAGSISLNHLYDGRGWLKGTGSDLLDLAYIQAPSGALYELDANGESVFRGESLTQGTNWIQGKLHSHYRYRSGQLSAIETDRELQWEFDCHPPIPLTEPRTSTGLSCDEVGRDQRGNIIRESRRANRREYLYQYDGWGLLSSAECGDFKTHFRYDPFGRRLSKLSSHRKSSRRRRINTSWYGLGLWSETQILDGKPRPATHYLHHPAARRLLCRWIDDTAEHYLLDPHGRPLALFSQQGEVLWLAAADSETLPRVIGGSCGPWRGRDLLADSETGLYYSPGGYWHPLLRCWLNRALPPSSHSHLAPEAERGSAEAPAQPAEIAEVTE